MYRSLPEVVQYLAIEHGQVDERGIAEVKVGTRKLFDVFLYPSWFGFGWTKAHLWPRSRNRSKMDVRVDQAWNKKLAFSRNYRCAGRLLRSFCPHDANDPSVFDQHAALVNVIKLFGRNDADVRNPDSLSSLPSGRLSKHCCRQ